MKPVWGTPFTLAVHVRLPRMKPAVGCSVTVTCALEVSNTYSLNCCLLFGSPVTAFTPPSCTSVKLGGSSAPAPLRLGLVVV